MNANNYLFAAYIVTWVIHLTYVGILLRKYSRLKDEITDLRKR